MNLKTFLFLSLAFAASSEASGEAANVSGRCDELIEGFVQTNAWSETGSQIIISAERGCASRIGRPLEMENVELAIMKGDRAIANFKTRNAVLSRDQNRLILGKAVNSIQKKEIGTYQSILVDLDKGSVRAPDSLYLRLTK